MSFEWRQYKIIAFYSIIALLIVSITSAIFIFSFLSSKLPINESKLVIIEDKSSVKSIVHKLTEDKIINHSDIFFIILKIASTKFYLKSGEYEITPNMDYFALIRKLKSRDVYIRKITIVEGLTFKQISEKLNNDPYLKGEININISEGYLMPSTYHYTYGDKRQNLILKMHNEMKNNLLQLTSNLDDFEIKQILTLASIVEKETSLEEERTKVASVYWNRIKKGMKLQADPTVIYAISNGYGQINRNLNYNDLKFDSPYNTYLYEGLPPGPICNPSIASIKAVLKPADTKYIFFVADGKGGHNFAESLADHNRNVVNYRKIQKNEQFKLAN